MLISVVQGMAQSTQSDVVSMGTTKNYYVNATPGSKYTWKINEESPLASTTNSVDITWTTPGIYTLTVQETTKDNCVGTVRYLQVTVIALTATISGTTSTCQNADSPVVTFTGSSGTSPYTFTYNINGGIYNTVTTTLGDTTVTVSVPTTIPGTFAYDLVNVTDSKGYTNDQTGTAIITIKGMTYSTTKHTICPLQLPYTWNGVEYTGPGTYYSIGLKNSQDCDSIATLELSVESPLVSRDTVTVCASDLPYVWRNKIEYWKSETIADTLTTPAGCDSVAILVLTVHSPLEIFRTVAVCEGRSYDFNGQSYAAPNTYDVQLKDVNGCDSIIVRLEVNQTKGSYTTQEIRLFSGETYSINGNTYSEAGVYTDSMKVADKCADIIVTELSFTDVPNTLTPNGDGMNDLFMAGHHVQIFNRNGIMLHDGQDGWDGKYKNKTVSKDTYFYVLYYDSESIIKSIEGYIMVIP